MRRLAYMPHLRGFEVELVRLEAEVVELRVVAVQSEAACPVCGRPSSLVHSRYQRHVTDLCWSRARVLLHVVARRFRCLFVDCPRRIFCERLPSLVAVYARHSSLLTALLQAVGLALGGRPGARLVGRLHLHASRMTLLRLVRQAPDPPAARTPRVLGVDEWAHRHGRRYGLILVDQECHRSIDLLPEASASTLATWLREHPGVEVVSRDRGGPLADGARQGAPAAVQVADRFHMLQNLGRVAERVVRRHATLVGRLPAPHVATLPTTLLRPDRQASRDRTRRALQDLLTAIQHQKASGASISSTARALHLNWKTVHKYWSTTEAAERRYTARPASSLTPYEGYLQERWRQGARKALPLWRELVQRGYPGKYQNVARYIAALRRLARGDRLQPMPKAGLSVRHAVAIALRRPDRRTPAEQQTLQSVQTLHPELPHVFAALEGFAALLRQRPMHPAAELEAWKAKALTGNIPELTAFIAKLEQDRDAVLAGLSLPYSQGQTEGQITRLKALKRAMFGRANFDLLRKRFLVAN